MEAFKKIEFISEIVKEYSMLPTVQPLGKAQCSMAFYVHDLEESSILPKDGTGCIEWIVEFLDDSGKLNGNEEVETIGIWFEKKTLVEYDGIFSLPNQAIKLLRQSGIRVPREFTN